MAGEFDLGYQLTQKLFIVPKDNLAKHHFVPEAISMIEGSILPANENLAKTPHLDFFLNPIMGSRPLFHLRFGIELCQE